MNGVLPTMTPQCNGTPNGGTETEATNADDSTKITQNGDRVTSTDSLEKRPHEKQSFIKVRTNRLKLYKIEGCRSTPRQASHYTIFSL